MPAPAFSALTALFSGQHLLSAHTPANPGGCLLLHCPRPIFQCGLDTQCRSFLECNAWTEKCAVDDMPCTVGCQLRSLDYDNAVFEGLSGCLAKSKCMPQVRNNLPLSRDVCRPPVLPATGLPFDFRRAFAGDWFISKGMNPVFDRFRCQRTRGPPPREDARLSSSTVDEDSRAPSNRSPYEGRSEPQEPLDLKLRFDVPLLDNSSFFPQHTTVHITQKASDDPRHLSVSAPLGGTDDLRGIFLPRPHCIPPLITL